MLMGTGMLLRIRVIKPVYRDYCLNLQYNTPIPGFICSRTSNWERCLL